MKEVKIKKWRVATTDPAKENDLLCRLHTNDVIARLLYNRHIHSAEEGQSFLYSSVEKLLDPFLLKDMERAVKRIAKAVTSQENIVIYGDYDVDGITATSLLYRFFKRLDANVMYYIPERQSEGYGLNEDALEHLIETGAGLVITVDCGISSTELVAKVKDRLDMIITDHHTPPEEIPQAYAVINPKQSDCTYPDKNLSGVGVAFKLCQAYWQRHKGALYTEDLDIVALGTVADVVPLVGENRIMVREGLRRINECPQLGIHRLILVAGQEHKKITAGTISFNLAPRLNAAGRVTHATEGVRLLISEDVEEAQQIAEDLQDTNSERQQIERSILQEARQNVIAQGIEADKIMVVAGENWHPGVIGIVASRLIEEFYKPALVISIHDGIGKGSCRSIENFDMYEALASVQDLLIQFGGHKQAAGFSIEAIHIPELRRRLTRYCEERLSPADYVPVVDIDTQVGGDYITVPHIEELALLEPYGMGNPTPVFSIENAHVKNTYLMGQDKQHVKFILEIDGQTLEAVSWFGREYLSAIFPGQQVRVACTLQINEWQGERKPQLSIQDIQPMEQVMPKLTEDGLREAYLLVKRLFYKPSRKQSEVEVDLLRMNHQRFHPMDLLLAVEVFKELGILKEDWADQETWYRWCHIKGKLDLFKSITFLKYSS